MPEVYPAAKTIPYCQTNKEGKAGFVRVISYMQGKNDNFLKNVKGNRNPGWET